jgi:hypothetical protein
METHSKHHTPTHKGMVFAGMGMGTKKYTHGLPMSHPNTRTLHPPHKQLLMAVVWGAGHS